MDAERPEATPSLDYLGTSQRGASCPTRRRVYDTAEISAFWVGCKRRGCTSDDCHRAWRRRTVASILSGLNGPEPVLFITFTAPGRDALRDPAAILDWNAGIRGRWTRVVRDLRRRHPGVRLEFARVRELQRRGAEHVHVLVRGVDHIPHAVLVEIATAAGFGRIVWVRPVGDKKGAASYLGSYLAKSRQVFPTGARVFATSAGWRRGWTKRETEKGRYISGPPEWMRLADWAESHADQGIGRKLGRLRRQREEQEAGGAA
jgi:hypothetical protein